jgi:broad specificity phosphatase PhoE
MYLLLARHGNTFEAHEKAVWVGARTDLPLTAKGREQAATLARALQPHRARISRIVAGPLRRTREHAEIVSEALGDKAGVAIDARLKEIDYGLWEGKPSEEIAEISGAVELELWNKKGIWPQSAHWSPPPELITRNVSGLANEIASNSSSEQVALLVTSNGILKFFLKLVAGAFDLMSEEGTLKVATGRCCLLRKRDGDWELLFWDREPAAVLDLG